MIKSNLKLANTLHMIYYIIHHHISSHLIKSKLWKDLQDEKNQLLITCLWLNLVIASKHFFTPALFYVSVSIYKMYLSQIARCIWLKLQNVSVWNCKCIGHNLVIAFQHFSLSLSLGTSDLFKPAPFKLIVCFYNKGDFVQWCHC